MVIMVILIRTFKVLVRPCSLISSAKPPTITLDCTFSGQADLNIHRNKRARAKGAINREASHADRKATSMIRAETIRAGTIGAGMIKASIITP